MLNHRCSIVAVTLCLGLCSAPLQAGPTSAFSIGSGPSYGSAYVRDQSYGNILEIHADIQVVALGLFDYEHDGFTESHEVGIFRMSDQVLLGSAVIPTGTAAALDGDFRYVAVTPFVLHAGESYMLSGHVPDPSSWVAGYASVSQIVFAPQISATAPANRYLIPSLSLEFPTTTGGTSEFYIGPNLRFELASVPEPSTLALALVAVFPLAVQARRRGWL